MSDPKIQIKNLYKIFGKAPEKALKNVQAGMSKDALREETRHVLGVDNVSLDIAPRNIQVVMGLSGSGKSTLIRHINRLIEPTAGEILVDGENVLTMDKDALRDLRRFKMSMVFQHFGLFPHRRVIENVAYGLIVQGVNETEADKRAKHWISRVGLEGYENNYPGQLSGGMRQRVGLARGLATDADILLMDEAFSALDPLIRYDMQSILIDLQKELHKTIVFITHDLDEALRIGDQIAILRDGHLVQQGSAQDIVLRPADGYIEDFIKDINRARVIKLGSLMTPLEGTPPADAPRLDAGTLLQEALMAVAQSDSNTVIVEEHGTVKGQVTTRAVIAALHG